MTPRIGKRLFFLLITIFKHNWGTIIASREEHAPSPGHQMTQPQHLSTGHTEGLLSHAADTRLRLSTGYTEGLLGHAADIHD